MDHWFALDKVLALGADPHRESLDVIAIRFPEEIVLDEAFDNCRAGHHALWSQANALAAELDLALVIGLEDGSNYGYTLGRYLTNQGCPVKEVAVENVVEMPLAESSAHNLPELVYAAKRLIIRTGNISMVVEDTRAASTSIEAMVERMAAGGALWSRPTSTAAPRAASPTSR